MQNAGCRGTGLGQAACKFVAGKVRYSTSHVCASCDMADVMDRTAGSLSTRESSSVTKPSCRRFPSRSPTTEPTSSFPDAGRSHASQRHGPMVTALLTAIGHGKAGPRCRSSEAVNIVQRKRSIGSWPRQGGLGRFSSRKREHAIACCSQSCTGETFRCRKHP